MWLSIRQKQSTLKKWQYLLGTAMPTLVLGGGGDFQLILKSILTDRQESVYCAHPFRSADPGADVEKQGKPGCPCAG